MDISNCPPDIFAQRQKAEDEIRALTAQLDILKSSGYTRMSRMGLLQDLSDQELQTRIAIIGKRLADLTTFIKTTSPDAPLNPPDWDRR